MAQLKYCDKHNQVGFLRTPDESAGFAEIVDFLRGSNLMYALTTNPTIYDSLATIDTIVYAITEASIRNKLQLTNASGITMLPNNEIFEGMRHMGFKSGGLDQFGSNIATALICLSTGRVYNFSKLIFDGMVANLKSKTKFLMGFRGAPRPLLPAMLLVATTNLSAGQEHPDVAQSQPSSSTIPERSTSLPPVQSPPPITTPILASTPIPIPEIDPEPMEQPFEEPSPAHQHFSPPQENAQEQMTVDDLLQLVP
ncbi:hypothetical protein Tco_0174137 [Tanacetum coccineum]